MRDLAKMSTHDVLHILRNPYGWSQEQVKRAQLQACDEIEKWQWRPITTAPKDGTWILLGFFLEGGGGGYPLTAWWNDTKKLWCDGYGFLNPGGYFSPTHWMPSPGPPM